MLEDKLYESDYFNIYVCQTYRTKYNKIKEQYHKELCIYLDFESDIFNYLFVHAMYYDKKKTIAVEYNLNMLVPKEIEESIIRMRYTTNTVEQLYIYLWNDIKKKDYITFK